jgi:hypothetical protein
MLPAPAPAMVKRSTLTIVMLFVAAFALLFGSGAAQASTYRFWNFWTDDNSQWTYSQLGPASTFPADGSVQGWVFAATDAESASTAPAINLADAFELACESFQPNVNQKRVALIIDSGSSDIAPSAQTPPATVAVCAVGNLDASGYELLNSVANLRTENGFVCAINGYPAMECSAAFEPAELTQPEKAATADTTATATESNAFAPITTALVIGLAAVAGFYFWRRRAP